MATPTYTESVTGRAGTVTINSVTMPINSWSATLRREYADATDSFNYDPTTHQTWTTQAPGVVGIDLTIEGNYDLSGTTDQNVTLSFLSDGPATGPAYANGWPVTLAFNRDFVWATCLATFESSDFNVSVPAATMITWSLSGKSQGIVTFNSPTGPLVPASAAITRKPPEPEPQPQAEAA